MNTDMRSRNALIVGASRGLGLGLTRELVARGWSVLATTRDLAAATELRALCDEQPRAVRVDTLDIVERAEAERFVADLKDAEIELALINAGVLGPAHQSAGDATEEELGSLFATNAVAPVRLARRLSARLRQPGGTLAFMSSRMGSVADNTSGGLDLYRASKAALNSLTRGLAATLGPDVTVINLHPGWVRTAMGGPNAPLDVETSARGLVDVVAQHSGRPGHFFLDYQGEEVPW